MKINNNNRFIHTCTFSLFSRHFLFRVLTGSSSFIILCTLYVCVAILYISLYGWRAVPSHFKVHLVVANFADIVRKIKPQHGREKQLLPKVAQHAHEPMCPARRTIESQT